MSPCLPPLPPKMGEGETTFTRKYMRECMLQKQHGNSDPPMMPNSAFS